MNVQPEKFYEACITHHLVNYFEMTLDKKIFPFSISQIEENKEGFDFGYKFSRKSFFIQYKRPYRLLPKDKYYWNIEIDQLKTINSKAHCLNTYYALPSFGSSLEWYDALENTFFIQSLKLESQINRIQGDKKVKSKSIDADKINLDKWNDIKSQFEASLESVVHAQTSTEITLEDILNYCKELDEEIKKTTWLYILE